MSQPADPQPPPQPLLIVVTGRPGAGKTTLAHALARAIRCPAICRDEIKEGFINTTGQFHTIIKADHDTGRHVYDAFFDTIHLLLSRRITHVAEASFQHKLWAPKLEPLQQIARIRIILCDIDARLARTRHIARGLADPIRERFHLDPDVQAAREGRDLPLGDYDPPHLNLPTLTVDTSDGYHPAFESIVAFASP